MSVCGGERRALCAQPNYGMRAMEPGRSLGKGGKWEFSEESTAGCNELFSGHYLICACEPHQPFAPGDLPLLFSSLYSRLRTLTGEHPERPRGVTAWLSPWKPGGKPEVHPGCSREQVSHLESFVRFPSSAASSQVGIHK